MAGEGLVCVLSVSRLPVDVEVVLLGRAVLAPVAGERPLAGVRQKVVLELLPLACETSEMEKLSSSFG